MTATSGAGHGDRPENHPAEDRATDDRGPGGGPPDGPGPGVTAQVCVIGLGPRGLAVLERFCANMAEHPPEALSLRLHLVDPCLTTGSRVWHTLQSTELLMNTVTSQITMFLDDTVECEGPVVAGPSLFEWSRFIALIGLFGGTPERVRTEAGRLGPNSYPSRAFYGHYLTWVLRHLIRTAPPNVSVVLHEQLAVDLSDAADGLQRVTLADDRVLGDLDAVVLAQGHLANRLVGRRRTSPSTPPGTA